MVYTGVATRFNDFEVVGFATVYVIEVNRHVIFSSNIIRAIRTSLFFVDSQQHLMLEISHRILSIARPLAFRTAAEEGCDYQQPG